MYRNNEGLTWDEWARAAGLPRPALETTLPYPEYEEWKKGVDPTEYGTIHRNGNKSSK